MKKIVLAALLVCQLAWAAPPQSTPQSPWNKGVVSAQRLSRAMEDRADFLQAHIHKDQKELAATLAALKKEFARNNGTLKGLEKKLATAKTQRKNLEEKFQRACADMATLEGSVRTRADHCIKTLGDSPVTAMNPGRLAPLRAFLRGKNFPSTAQIKALCDIYLEEIVETGRVRAQTGEFINGAGQIERGTLIRAGGFFLGFDTPGGTGFLSPSQDSPNGIPTAVTGLPWKFGKTIQKWHRGDALGLCMDITRGAALDAQTMGRDLSQWFEAGGLLLWPILAIALAGLGVIAYKASFLFTRSTLSKTLVDELETPIKNQDDAQCRTLLSPLGKTPAARVLLHGIPFYHRGLEALDNGLEEARVACFAHLNRGLALVGVFAAMAPLLGLLGTVTGMIATFQTITLFGTGDPRLLSTGISEALVTTQAGLGVTIPLMLIHHLLKRRVSALMDDVDQACAGLVALVAALPGNQSLPGQIPMDQGTPQ